MAPVTSSGDLPRTKPWHGRSSAMSWIPGTPAQIIPRLRVLLETIRESSSVDERFEWPDDEGETTVRATVRAFGRSGLYVRDTPSSLKLTDEANEWLRNNSDSYLMALFHSNVRYFGELLNEVSRGATTHEALRRVAVEHYALPWESLDQVRRRTTWLRAAKLIELWSSNELVLTDLGNVFLTTVDLVDPKMLEVNRTDNVDQIAASIRDPGPRIAAELDKLDQRALRLRKKAISFIPGGDPIDVIQQLVSLAESPITRDKFELLCAQEFKVAASSASMSLYALRAASLLKQVGPTTFQVSEIGSEWLESDNALDLVRIFHANFLAIGELLAMLDEPQGAGELSRRLEVELGISSLTKEEVARRLRILEAAGLVYRVTQMSCQVTQLGRALFATLPVQQPVQDNAIIAQASDIVDGQTVGQAGHLTTELIDASTDVSNPTRFEKAVASALNYLGFSATHLGGPGRTDVLVEAWLGPGSSKTIAIETKTSASGVKDSIEFNVLRDHRKRHKATVSVVIAPGFDPRLLSWEKDEGVALVTARSLALVVEWQTAYPIPLSELARAFEIGGIDDLREAWATVQRRNSIVAEVVARLWRSANNIGHVQASGGALSARDLWLMMLADDNAASQEEISDVLQFLASPLIGAVEAKKGDSFVSTSPPSAVMARLEAMRTTIGGRVSAPPLDPTSATVQTAAASGQALTSAPVAATKDSHDLSDAAEVRRWATAQGLNVAPRGRLPSHLFEKFRQAKRDELPT